MLVVGVVYGALDRARERPRKMKRKNEEEIYAKKRRRISLAHDRRPACTTSKRAKRRGGRIKKRELGKDLKLVYNDVELRTIMIKDDGERRDFCFSGEGTAHPLISILDSYFFYPFLRFIIM